MPESKITRRVDRQSSVTIESPENPFVGNLTLDDDNNGVAMVKLAGDDELVVALSPHALQAFSEIVSELASSFEELRVTELGQIDNPDAAQDDDSSVA